MNLVKLFYKDIIYLLKEAIKYLHGLKIYHFDIKPENIMMNNLLDFKLIDFGNSKIIPNK